MPSIVFNLPFLIFNVMHPVINNPAINCVVRFSFYLLGDYSNEFKHHLPVLPTENGSGLQARGYGVIPSSILVLKAFRLPHLSREDSNWQAVANARAFGFPQSTVPTYMIRSVLLTPEPSSPISSHPDPRSPLHCAHRYANHRFIKFIIVHAQNSEKSLWKTFNLL